MKALVPPAPRIRTLAGLAALLLLAALSGGCAIVHRVDKVLPEQPGLRPHPAIVKALTRSGEVHTFPPRNPATVVDGALVHRQVGRIPLDEIEMLWVRRTDASRNTLANGVLLVGAWLAFLVVL